MKIIEEAPMLRHFTAKLQWLNSDESSAPQQAPTKPQATKARTENPKIY
jgi:hypothetical protein